MLRLANIPLHETLSIKKPPQRDSHTLPSPPKLDSSIPGRIILLGLLFAMSLGCRKEPVYRHYREIAEGGKKNPVSVRPSRIEIPVTDHPLPARLSWSLPKGWKPRSPGALILHHFAVPGDLVCTISAFPGRVGSLSANLTRWARQIDLSLGARALKRLEPHILRKEGKHLFLLVDFTPLVTEGNKPAITAAVFRFLDQTVFVRLMGTKDGVASRRSEFVRFCQSIE